MISGQSGEHGHFQLALCSLNCAGHLGPMNVEPPGDLGRRELVFDVIASAYLLLSRAASSSLVALEQAT